MGLTKPGFNAPTNDLANLLKCKMHAFVALGSIDKDEIPTTAAEIDALYSGLTPTFVPLGDLSKEPIEINLVDDGEDVHLGKIPGVKRVEVNIKSLAMHNEMIKFIDNEATGILTLMFVPFRNPLAAVVGVTNPSQCVIVTDLTLVPGGSINGNNKYPMADLKFSTEPTKFGDVVKLIKVTT